MAIHIDEIETDIPFIYNSHRRALWTDLSQREEKAEEAEDGKGNHISAWQKKWHGHATWPKSTKFDPTNHISAWHLDPVHLIWTKFGVEILLDLRKKHIFSFYSKSKMATGDQKLNLYKNQNQPNLTPQITFQLGKWILFIWFGQNLTETYHLTLGTRWLPRPSLRKKL